MEIIMEDIGKDDLVIAVMGPAGSGKSHFIDVLRRSGSRPDHRSGRRSSPSAVVGIQNFILEHYEKNRPFRVVLVDVPALDDLESLTMVGEWLEKTYRKGIKLSGILYLHPISDNRISAVDLRALRIFGELCGDAAMPRVILVSTKWDQVDEVLGKRRECELKDKYWCPMLAHGAKTERFDNSSGSAKNVVDYMILNEQERITLLIQEELIELDKPLIETYAAQHLKRTLQELSSNQKALVEKLSDQADKERKTKSRHFFQPLRNEVAKAEKELMKTLGDIQQLEASRSRKLRLRFGGKEKKGEIKPLSTFSTSSPDPSPPPNPNVPSPP